MNQSNPNNKTQQVSTGITRLPGCLIGKIKAISPFIINANAKIEGPIFNGPPPPKALDGDFIINLNLLYEEGIIINLSVSKEGIISIDFGEQSFWVNTP
jgi:hypothetical protein